MRLNKRMTMVLALLLSVIGADVFAQEVADSVWVDSVEVDSVALAEEFKSNYDSEEDKARMDSLIQVRYVIVSKNGKYGIYDCEKNDSVTAVDMDYIEYSHYFQPEDGMCFCYFYYEKGLQCGKIGINMNDNTKVDAFADNPKLVASLDEYTSIDSLITEKCYDVLDVLMREIDGIQGQVAVIDARTSEVLAWGALENTDGAHAYTALLKRFSSSEIFMPFIAADCLAQSNTSMEDSVDLKNGILEVNDSMWVRDHNFRRGGYGKLTYRQALLKRSRISMFLAVQTLNNDIACWKQVADTTKNTNAMEMATVFNNVYHVDTINIDSSRRKNIQEIATGIFKEGGIQYKFAPKDVELAGMYNVVSDGNEQTISFVGCFPADKPKYAVSMVVHRKHKLPASPALVSDKVNGLIEWLNKK